MRKLVGMAMMMAMVTAAPAWAAEPSTHLRLLFHGNHKLDTSGLGVAAWVVAPTVADAPGTWLWVAGPAYQTDDWSLEVMGGALVAAGERTPLVDIRADLSLLSPFYTWVNLEWIDPGEGSDALVYWYLQADYVLTYEGQKALVGVETEDLFQRGADPTLSVGPHLFLPLGKAVFQVAYQVHKDARDQLWFRLLVNL